MILTRCGHRRIPTLWRLLERNLSTKSHPAKSHTESHRAAASEEDEVSSQTSILPTPKMRALISLFHQADSWVTPENLSQKIDEAFVPVETPMTAISTAHLANMVSVSNMKDYIAAMRNAPKMAQWDSSSSGNDDRSVDWSDSGKSRRELKVMEAMYGVETTILDRPKALSEVFLPGLEVLQETASAAIRDYNADREAENVEDLLQK